MSNSYTNNLLLRSKPINDSFQLSFKRKKQKIHLRQPDYTKITSGNIEDLSYKNVLTTPLKSTPNPDFEVKLSEIPGIIDFNNAKKRVSSFSRYLKEDMIGFVVPEYEIQGEKKGGYQWMEKAAEYLLKGCQKNATEKDYPILAINLFGLLATYDNYWKSNEFSDYLSTLKPGPAIKAIQSAIKSLQTGKNISFSGNTVKMWGFFSPIKSMKKFLNDGCAYTGTPLKFDDPLEFDDLSTEQPYYSPKENASLDHLMPNSWGGPCEDYNYVLASQEINSTRLNLDLLSFLKGGKGKNSN